MLLILLEIKQINYINMYLVHYFQFYHAIYQLIYQLNLNHYIIDQQNITNI